MPWGVVAAVGGALVSGWMAKDAMKDASSEAGQIARIGDPMLDFKQGDNGLAAQLNNLLQSDSTANTYGALSGTGSKLAELLSNPDSVTQTKQFQSALNQGLGAANQTMSAQGMVGSGAQLLGLSNYANSQANTAYNTQLQQLSGLYGQELGALNQQTSLLGNVVNAGSGNASSAMAQIMAAQQGASSGNAQAGGDAFGSIIGAAGDYFSKGASA